MERVCVGGWDMDELRYVQLELTWRALGWERLCLSVLTIVGNVGTLKQRQAMGGEGEASLVV